MVVPAGYWYWRIGAHEHGRAVRMEVVHTRLGTVVRCSRCTVWHAARLANALNRAYGSKGAPVYSEQTGAVIDFVTGADHDRRRTGDDRAGDRGDGRAY